MLLAIYLLLLYNEAGVSSFFSMDGGLETFRHRLPLPGFLVVAAVMTVPAFFRNLSLIPVLGLLTNLYLMSELGITNWSRFLAWLALVIYFAYGYRNSKLGKPQPQAIYTFKATNSLLLCLSGYIKAVLLIGQLGEGQVICFRF